MLGALLLAIIATSNGSVAFSYTEEEQYRYNNILLQLPWEPAKYEMLTQQNRDTPTHLIGSIDEYALDFSLVEGTPIVAAAPGVAYVYKAGHTNASAYGNHVKIDHGYFYTLYAHLSSVDEALDGYEVGKGKVIGLSGHTGLGTGPHLHFGLYHGYAWNDGYSYSVESKIVVASEGVDPYRTLQSLQFRNGQFYLSGNFKTGQGGVIVCDGGECYVDTSFGVGGGSLELPDFTAPYIRLKNEQGVAPNAFRPGQIIKMTAKTKNEGAASPRGIKAKFYLSQGKEVDANKEAKETVNIDVRELEKGETHTITAEMHAPAKPGIYNIVACFDTDKAVAEEHESNNCTTEAIFKVDDFAWMVPIISLILN